MKRILFYFIVLFQWFAVNSQTTSKYFGGKSDGFSDTTLIQSKQVPYYSKYTGGKGCGFANKTLQQTPIAFYSKFTGGTADGFSQKTLVRDSNVLVYTKFLGGTGDGFATQTLNQTKNVLVFNKFTGGTADGFSSKIMKDTFLMVSVNKLSVSANQDPTATFTIYSNAKWTTLSNQSWITVTPASSTGNGSITLTASANTGAIRTAIVTVLNKDGVSQTIMVTQAAYSTSVTKSALIAAITNANTLYNSAIIGTAIGNYPSKTALGAAINTASILNLDAKATQIQVDEALVNLQNAITAFKNSKITAITATSVSLVATTPLSLKVGDSQTLTYILFPINSTANLVWTSSNPNTVTVDQNGKITAVGTSNGNVTITVALANDLTKTSKVTITVNQILLVSNNSISNTATGGSVTVNITSNTAWTASSNKSWVTVTPSSGSGNGTIVINSSNNTDVARTALVTISAPGVASQTITVTQAAFVPSVSVSSTIANLTQDETTITISITSNTTLSASSNQSWLKVGTAWESGNEFIILSASKNLGKERYATVTLIVGSGVNVITKTIMVTQAAYEVSTLSVSNSSISNTSKGGTFNVSISSNTTWYASSNQTWVKVTPSSGSGNGSIYITTTANTGLSRYATVTVFVYSGTTAITKTITVTQAAYITLSNNSISNTSNGGSVNVTITSNNAWTASSNQSWVTVTPLSGSGNGTIVITASANNDVDRTALVTISAPGVASQTITVTQAAFVPMLSVSSNAVSIGYIAGSTASVAINSNSTWVASSDKTWLTVSPNTATSGNATLYFTTTANKETPRRSATITISIGGVPVKTVTVTQLGLYETPVEEVSNNEIIVYPNPTSTNFYIGNLEESALVQLYSVCGEMVLCANTSGNETIPISNVPAGLYIVKIITANAVLTKALIVE